MSALAVTPWRDVVHTVEWNPWRELRSRAHIEFSLDTLPESTGGALYWPFGPWAAIVIDRNLPRRLRKAALAHELIHDERGGTAACPGQPGTWDDVVARDEHAVDREVAVRLVPRDRLVAFIRRHTDVESIGVTVHEVAEEFDVPDTVALEALRQLRFENSNGWETA